MTRTLRKSIYPSAAGHGLYWAARLRLPGWDAALQDIEGTQTRELRGLIAHAKRTEFGRAHRFAEIRSYEEWVEAVPLGSYDSFWPGIERMMQGEENVLVPEFVTYFGNSSGSSNKGRSKFLPITERQVRLQQQMSADVLFRYLVAANERDMTSGFVLGLLPPTTMKAQGPVKITSNPGLMFAKLPAAARPLYIPRGEIRNEPDYDTKLGLIADHYLDHDVRAVSGTTCWFSLMFDKLLGAARRKGRKAETVRDIWPNLRLLLGGGVSAKPYLSVIEDRLGGSDFTLVDTYNATEGGIYACTDHSGRDGLLMIVDRGVFFEFVPLESRTDPEPRRIPLWSVEPGVPYSIVVTTPSGLYAYELGDIVRFTDVDPPRIEFMGRLAGCLSTTQELTTHVEIEQAVRHALDRFDAKSVDFGASADVGVNGTSKSRYVLFLELQGEATPDPEAFAEAFDEGLRSANRVYREHRSGDCAILKPEVSFLPPGAVQRFMQVSGRTSVQTKFPRILDEGARDTLRALVPS
ncbi:MAG: GH3 auxin-responsive promoter family protein [Myxococcota bacterium]